MREEWTWDLTWRGLDSHDPLSPNDLGTVIRIGMVKMLEYEREFICDECKHVFTVQVSTGSRPTGSATVVYHQVGRGASSSSLTYTSALQADFEQFYIIPKPVSCPNPGIAGADLCESTKFTCLNDPTAPPKVGLSRTNVVVQGIRYLPLPIVTSLK